MKFKDSEVSVIIPVYNGETFLLEALESIKRQTYQPLEIIIVDDGSTDDTAKVAKTFQGNVIYSYQVNHGPAAARNKGLRMAQGDVIAFLDADDLWSENKLEVQLLQLENDSAVEIVLGHTKRMWAKPGTHNYDRFTEPELALKLDSCLVRRSVFDKVGHFDESLRCCEDWDWFLRARELGVSFVTHAEVMAYYRRHDRNLTLQKEINDKYFAIVIKRSLERRRKQKRDLVNLSLPKLSSFIQDSAYKLGKNIDSK